MTKMILLIDGEFRRRATITHSLRSDALHVEPFEDAAELPTTLPETGAVLVYDNGCAVGDVVERMSQTGRWLPIICFSEQPNLRKVVDALKSGASDYLTWPFSIPEIEGAVDASIELFGSGRNARIREAKARSKIDRLTGRERDVLAGVANGLSNRLIGERLAISPRTVEIHRANMLDKLGANHTSEAIRIAFEAALPS